MAPAHDPHRLSTVVRPSRYDVRLRPSLDDASFTGTVRIDVVADEPVDAFTLNAADLHIESCVVDGATCGFELDDELERLTITGFGPMSGSTATLDIRFRGVLNDKLRGFYRSTYTDADGTDQVIATTQMQSTDCRRAFPCWDEPEFKAVFGITLDVADGLTAVSNGSEVARTVEEPGRTVVRFADTMLMSTYLVAFVVGRLDVTEPVDVDGIPLRIVHVPGKADLTAFGTRRRRILSPLVPGLLRHPLSERQGRLDRAAGLRRRRDGEPGLHHVPGEPAARGSGTPAPSRNSSWSRTWSHTNWPTCGSAISSRCAGGTASG